MERSDRKCGVADSAATSSARMAKKPGSTPRLSASRATVTAVGRLAPDSQPATAVGLMSSSWARSDLRRPASWRARARRAPSKNAATSAARGRSVVVTPVRRRVPGYRCASRPALRPPSMMRSRTGSEVDAK